MAAHPPTFAQLEQAALHILRLISDAAGLENTRLAVTGDLAVCKYLPRFDQVKASSDPIPSTLGAHLLT